MKTSSIWFLLDPKDKHTQADYMHEVEEGNGMKVERADGTTVWLDWNDSVSFLGNASEPFDIELLVQWSCPTSPTVSWPCSRRLCHGHSVDGPRRGKKVRPT